MAGTIGRLNVVASVESTTVEGDPASYVSDGCEANMFANGLPLVIDQETLSVLVAAISSGIVTLAQVSVQVGDDYHPLTVNP